MVLYKWRFLVHRARLTNERRIWIRLAFKIAYIIQIVLNVPITNKCKWIGRKIYIIQLLVLPAENFIILY